MSHASGRRLIDPPRPDPWRQGLPAGMPRQPWLPRPRLSSTPVWRTVFTVNAYAATSATEPLTQTTVERRDVGPHDVLIEMWSGTAPPPRVDTPLISSSTRTSSLYPRRRRPGPGRPAAVCGNHHVLAAAPLGRRPRQDGSRCRARRTRSHGRAVRACDGCGSHRPVPVVEEGGRRSAPPVRTTTTQRATLPRSRSWRAPST